jgi:sporulation protein YlmC with PRC-barrel domain
MAEHRSAPSGSVLRARYEHRVERLTASRHVRSELVSLAGLVGKPMINQAGQQIGRVADVVARWDSNQPCPPATGLIVRVGRRRAWLPADAVKEFGRDRIRLHTARVDLREVMPSRCGRAGRRCHRSPAHRYRWRAEAPAGMRRSLMAVQRRILRSGERNGRAVRDP